MTLTTGEYPCRNGRIRNDEIEFYFKPMEKNHVSFCNLINVLSCMLEVVGMISIVRSNKGHVPPS